MKELQKFYEQLSNFEPPDSLSSTLFELKKSIPISSPDFDVVFTSDEKFLDFQAYVTTFVSNTRDYLLDRNEAKDLRKITNDHNILNYWERLKFLVILGTINGTPNDIPSKFTFGPWFHPIENDLKREAKRFHLESVISYSPKTKLTSALPFIQESWFAGKTVDSKFYNTSDPLIQRCAKMLQEHPFGIGSLIESLTYTLEFQITAAMYRLNAGDKQLSTLLRFYVDQNKTTKYPSILMNTVFSESTGFPNASLAKLLNNPSNFEENVKIHTFKPNFWDNVHPNHKEQVVDYLTKYIKHAQFKAKPSLKYKFVYQGSDISDIESYVIEMQLNIYNILLNEINIQTLGFVHKFIYPKEWKSLHPFYFDPKNKEYLPSRLYLPNVDIASLPSYFVGPNLKQELETFHQLNQLFQNKIPINKNPVIYTNDNFWNKPNQIYHVIQFSPRPIAKIGFQNIATEDINKAFKFEEDFRNQKTSGIPDFSTPILAQWAQELFNKKSVGTQDLNLLLDVYFYFLGKKLGGLTEGVATKMGISPFMIELIDFSQPQLQPQTQPQPQQSISTVTDYFSSRKGKPRRSRSKRRSPRRRPRRRVSRVNRKRRINSHRRRLT
jgi:hypothetical protein